ncbi:MAG: carboxylating nicotinate-nucleotide diphosphorylase [Candidatus Kapaibacteriota bacterium]
MAKLTDAAVLRLIQFALHEDLGSGDVTTEMTVLRETSASARFLMKQDGVVCGMPLLSLVFRQFSADVEIVELVRDGDRVPAGTVLATLEGPAHALLGGERTALNFLQRMSGVATKTAQYVERIAGTRAQILDTRKTIPGWRVLDKYAAQIGGAVNHRMGLFDMVMIKDNHITAAGGITAAIQACVQEMMHRAPLAIEVEAQTLDDVAEILRSTHVKRVMFDNFTPEMVAQGVEMVQGVIETEASGGITFDTIRAYAETGVDYISTGAITHSATAIDISMKLVVPRTAR